MSIRAEILDDQGEGIPILYVPGVDGSGLMLLGAADRIAREFRLIRLCYQSVDEAPDDYESLAASLVTCIEASGLERAILLSESFGGAITLQAALDRPYRVAALALVNSFSHYSRRLRLALSRVSAPLVPRPLFHFGRRMLAPALFFGKLREPDAIRRFRAEAGVCFDAPYRRRLALISRLDLRRRLKEIQQPVSLFAGDRDRVVDSLAQARSMCDALRNAELEVIEGGGHLILPLEKLPWPRWLMQLAERARM
ncbi:MAG: alpha/beta fold hydrolase [Planctomycetota bacterium]